MFLVLLRHSGPEWDLALPMDQQSKWREHANYMDESRFGDRELGAPDRQLGHDVVLVSDAVKHEASNAAW